MARKSRPEVDADALARRIEAAYEELRPRFRDIEPRQLVHILHGLLRPFGTGKVFLLKKRRGGGYVF